MMLLVGAVVIEGELEREQAYLSTVYRQPHPSADGSCRPISDVSRGRGICLHW